MSRCQGVLTKMTSVYTSVILARKRIKLVYLYVYMHVCFQSSFTCLAFTYEFSCVEVSGSRWPYWPLFIKVEQDKLVQT